MEVEYSAGRANAEIDLSEDMDADLDLGCATTELGDAAFETEMALQNFQLPENLQRAGYEIMDVSANSKSVIDEWGVRLKLPDGSKHWLCLGDASCRGTLKVRSIISTSLQRLSALV